MKRHVLLLLFVLLVSVVPAFAETPCQAILSSDPLRLHIPVVRFMGYYFSIDMNIIAEPGGSIGFTLAGAGTATDTDCYNPAELWMNPDNNAYHLHIPSVSVPAASISLWADLECAADIYACAGGTPWTLTNYSMPVSIGVTKDAGRTVSAVMTPENGGTLSVTAQDGTVFALAVPANALLHDETITLTPVTKISGLPLSGGMKASVHISPEGLHLLTPATLAIRMPSPVNQSKTIGFGYMGDGQEMYLYPKDVSGSTITLSLNHFSGYGVGEGSQNDVSSMDNRKPSGAMEQAEQQLSQAIEAGRSTNTFPTPEQLKPIFQSWYKSSIKPQLTAGETDDTKFVCAFNEYGVWARTLSLLGLGPLFSAEFEISMRSIAKGLYSAFNKSYDRCVTEHDPAEAGVLLDIARSYVLLGFANDPDFLQMNGSWYTIDNVMKKISDCARFEITFDSRIVRDTSGSSPSTWTFLTQTTAVTRMDRDTGSFYTVTELSPLAGSDNLCGPGGCVSMYSWQELALKVFSLDVSGLGKKTLQCGGVPKGRPNLDITMKYNFALPDPSCPDCDLYVPLNNSIWRYYYNALHAEEYFKTTDIQNWWDPYYRMTGFVPHPSDAPDILAKKEYVQNATTSGGSEELQETTLFTIVHKPKVSP